MGKAREQINGLRLLILEIGNQWEQLATSMSLAYGKARKSQEEILNGIKPAVEEFANWTGCLYGKIIVCHGRGR